MKLKDAKVQVKVPSLKFLSESRRNLLNRFLTSQVKVSQFQSNSSSSTSNSYCPCSSRKIKQSRRSSLWWWWTSWTWRWNKGKGTVSSSSLWWWCWRALHMRLRTVMCFLLGLSVAQPANLVSAAYGGMEQMSPRVVLTKGAQFQGFLGPKNVRYSGYGGGSSYGHGHGSDPYNYRTYGHPIVEIFKGIPYASPPLDTLRYESPVPFPLKSNEVYSANVTKPACPRFYNSTLDKLTNLHDEDPLKAIRKLRQMEDCLYLDIYAPLNTKKENGPGLPVLVYANSQPDDPNDPFDGSSVAAIGQIIVVSFRYRVGVIGFLQPSYYAEDVRSNFGMWDQLAALQWIRENINAFGGDENNISLMGNDLDASLISILAMSPLSQAYGGLFHRLILLNGSPFSPISINHRPLETTVHLARALKCSLQDRSAELLNCLRHKPITLLLGAAQTIGSHILSYHFAPSVDGTIIQSELGTLTTINPHFPNIVDALRRYDILCGLGEGPVLPNIGKSVQFWQNLNLDRFVTAAIRLALNLDFGTEPTNALKQDVIRAVKNEYGESPLMRELVSDFLMINPMIQLLNKHSETGKQTYFFVSKNYDPLHKAKHSELPYIFSTDVYNWKYVNSDNPKNMHLYPFEAMISLIANFVRSGDPNRPDLRDQVRNPEKSWPRYKRDQGRYLKFGREVELVSKYRHSQVTFWSQVFPALLKPYLHGLTDAEGTNGWQFPTHFGQTPYFHPSNITHIYPTGDSASAGPTTAFTLAALTENTIIIVGGLIFLLNLLCFMGIFYQRQRLRRIEVELRRKYNLQPYDPKDQVGSDGDGGENAEDDDSSRRKAGRRRRQEGHDALQGGDERMLELESNESEPYQITSSHRPPSHSHPLMHPPPPQRLLQIQQQQQAPLDTLSETETDNGFGPNFLTPNYDPRTKVSRWMQQQRNGNGDSSKDRSSPPIELELRQPPSHIHESPYPYHVHPYPHHPQPVHIHINTGGAGATARQLPPVPPPSMLGRQPYLPSGGYEPIQHHHHVPVHPFQPPGSDIPYADSRTTSPSISTYTQAPVPGKFPPNNNLSAPSNTNSLQRTSNIQSSSGQRSYDDPNYESLPKRTSVVVPVPIRNSIIIRELEDNPDEVESSEPRVQIKSGYGTLKRSVGVGENGTQGETSSISNGSTATTAPPSGLRTAVQKVTFADGL